MTKKKKTGKKKIKIPGMKVASLGQLARRAVKMAQRDGGTGAEKGMAARRMFAQWLDESLRFGDGPIGQAAEALDGPVGMLIGSIVQGAYEDLKAGGGL
ncbi:MAG: hypothetical protein KAQ88_01885 [Hyphomicrobiaceae bacterium]|nr:hypothetical protein [Hyphomicrobiaceae bacterium]